MPDLNDINTPWLKIIETADDLRSAALQMRRKSFGSALKALPEDAKLSDYEDALDRHYFKSALKSALQMNNPATSYLKDYLRNGNRPQQYLEIYWNQIRLAFLPKKSPNC